jgi:hypothetical protein
MSKKENFLMQFAICHFIRQQIKFHRINLAFDQNKYQAKIIFWEKLLFLALSYMCPFIIKTSKEKHNFFIVYLLLF